MEIPLLARFIFLLYAFFTAFRLFVLFLFVTFLFLNFSAWIFLHGFGFWIRTFFTWRIIFFSSCSSLLFRSCASFPVRGFSAFMLFRRTFSFFAFSGTALLFSDSTRKCLFPFNAHLRLNRTRCRRVSGLFFFRNLYKRCGARLFILPLKGTGKCPYRRSDSHALSDSLKSRMPIVRRTRTLYRHVVYLFSKYVFGFFETYVSSAGSP